MRRSTATRLDRESAILSTEAGELQEIHYGKNAVVLRGQLREVRARERPAADEEVG